MGHHQQRLVTPLQEPFKPLNHLKVEMVGRLVKYQEVGLGYQYVGQGYAFLLTAAELSHRLLKVTNLQLCQNLLGLQHFFWVALMVEAGIEHTLFGIENRRLLQHANADVASVDDFTLVVAFLARQYREKR